MELCKSINQAETKSLLGLFIVSFLSSMAANSVFLTGFKSKTNFFQANETGKAKWP
jgi:hypothetical protein